VLYVVEVEYSVVDGDSNASAVLSVSVLRPVNDLLGTVVFVGEPSTYANEAMHFVFVAARHGPDMEYSVDYGDGTASSEFDASGTVSPIPDWAGAAVANAFRKDIRECGGAVLEHVYTTVGMYTARVRVTAADQSAGGRYDELTMTTDVSVTVRLRTLAQVRHARTPKNYKMLLSLSTVPSEINNYLRMYWTNVHQIFKIGIWIGTINPTLFSRTIA